MEFILGAKSLSATRMPDQASEAALVERCRNKDVEAFGRLVDAYQARVLGFVRRMVRNAEEADDVTQEVFIRAFQSFERFDGRAPVRTWLFRIAYNLCVDRSRKDQRSPKHLTLNYSIDDEEQMDVPDSRWEPQQMILDDELMGVLEQGIALMSEKLRSVLLLHDREDMAYEEIAQTLGLPVGTVKSRLFLARAFLQNHMRPYLEGARK
ncbi:MAG: sigma-70 family RNA polymerase sigma factor [Fimbriimonas sp.]